MHFFRVKVTHLLADDRVEEQPSGSRVRLYLGMRVPASVVKVDVLVDHDEGCQHIDDLLRGVVGEGRDSPSCLDIVLQDAGQSSAEGRTGRNHKLLTPSLRSGMNPLTAEVRLRRPPAISCGGYLRVSHQTSTKPKTDSSQAQSARCSG